MKNGILERFSFLKALISPALYPNVFLLSPQSKDVCTCALFVYVTCATHTVVFIFLWSSARVPLLLCHFDLLLNDKVLVVEVTIDLVPAHAEIITGRQNTLAVFA